MAISGFVSGYQWISVWLLLKICVEISDFLWSYQLFSMQLPVTFYVAISGCVAIKGFLHGYQWLSVWLAMTFCMTISDFLCSYKWLSVWIPVTFYIAISGFLCAYGCTVEKRLCFAFDMAKAFCFLYLLPVAFIFQTTWRHVEPRPQIVFISIFTVRKYWETLNILR